MQPSTTTTAAAAAFIAGGAAGGFAVWWWFKSNHALQTTRNAGHAARQPQPQPQPQHMQTLQHEQQAASPDELLKDEIVVEQLTRNIQFFGLESQRSVMAAFVVVVGLGGVGSHAAHMLLRGGVARLRLVDFDQVTLSSLNRHALATRADVGISKAACLRRHFAAIFPEASVEAMVKMYNNETEDEVLADNPSFVLDAIDNIDTKVALLAACKRRGIRVLSVAGAGAKADPTRIRIADISESNVDPLARAVRQRLRKEHGIEAGIAVVLSTEKPRCSLVATEEMEAGNPLDFQIVPNFRVRTIPVLGTAPALFGMAAASYMLCELAGKPFIGESMVRYASDAHAVLLQRLMEREEVLYGSAADVAVDVDDVAYLVKEIWRGCSAMRRGVPYAGQDKGLYRRMTDLTLTRWDKSLPAVAHNLVLLTFHEAEQLEHGDHETLACNDQSLVAFIEQRLAVVKRDLNGCW